MENTERIGQPLVSLIVPMYNTELYLNRFFKSIMAQDYSNLEVLVWDDGSTDGSLDFAHRYAQQDDRIRVFHADNQGVAAARRESLRRAKGEYIAFADPDDWIEPDYVSTMICTALDEHSDIVVCGCRAGQDPLELPESALRLDERSHSGRPETISGQDAGRRFLERAFLPENHKIRAELWGKLFKRRVMEDVEVPTMRTSSDVPMVAQAIGHARTVSLISDRLYHYQVDRQGSLQTKVSTGKLADIWAAHKWACRVLGPDVPSESVNLSSLWSVLYIYDRLFQGRKSMTRTDLKQAYSQYLPELKQCHLPKTVSKRSQVKYHVLRSGFVVSKMVYRFLL